MSSLVERSFVGGELTPAMWARVDQQKYQNGLKTARNGYIMRQGGFTNRPGTAMIAAVRDSTQKVRLIPFVFSNSVAYALELGNQYARVYRAGAQIQYSGSAWSSSTAYAAGTVVSYSGNFYTCILASTNNTPNTSPLYWENEGAGGPFQFNTPWGTADLPNIQYVQSENVLYLSCAGYPVQMITCTADTAWAVSQLNYTPTVAKAPRPAGILRIDHGNTNRFYVDGNNKINGIFMVFGTIGGNVNNNGSIWDYTWASSALLDYLVPGGATGTAGIPSPPVFLEEYFMVTALNLITGIESLPILGGITNMQCANAAVAGFPFGNVASIAENIGINNTSPITAIGFANPLTITVNSTSLGGIQVMNSNDLFTISGTNIPELDGQTLVGVVNGNVITFVGVDSTKFAATSPAVSPSLACCTSCITTVPHTVTQAYDSTHIGNLTLGNNFENSSGWNTSPIQLAWSAPVIAGSYSYNVYKKSTGGLWGFMGNVSSPAYTDDGSTTPDTSKGPPVYANNFIGIGSFPSVIGVYQQRLCLANTPSQQENFWASNTGEFQSFTTSTPSVDSDSVAFQVAGKKYNPVTQIIDNGFLLIFSESGEFSCLGDASGALTPTAINLRQQAFYGASSLLSPIPVGKNVLYVQSRQSKVRELLYNYYINGYSGTDITIFSNHLFDGYTFVDWCYAQEPNSVVWMVRSDGVLLSLTYIPEQQLMAWTRHDTTAGVFEQVVSIPEGNEDAIYCVVNRTINGSSVRYVERFASRFMPLVAQMKYLEGDTDEDGTVVTEMVPDVARSVFMDCSTYYDGRYTADVTTMTPEAGSYAPDGGGFTMVAGNPTFNAGMVGNTAVMLTDPTTGKVYRCAILVYLNSTHVTCRPDATFPASFAFAPFSVWALGVNTVSGLDYLDGQLVSVLADGAVLSSPAPQTGSLTVAAGSITLNDYYAYVRVGLPYFTDIQTLDIDTPQQGQSNQDKMMFTSRLGIYANQTRGIWGGSTPPPDDGVNCVEGLNEYSARTDDESMGTTPDTKTGIMLETIQSKWAFGGSLFMRQVDPLPMTVLAVVPAGLYKMGG